jgi:uncharacterized protein
MDTPAHPLQPAAPVIPQPGTNISACPQEIEDSARVPAWLTTFIPRRGLSNGHLQTIVGDVYPRPNFHLVSSADEVLVDPSDNSRVLCHSHWQPGEDPGSRLTLVLVHGLEGSSDSRYIQGLTMRAWSAGCNVVRMNMRNCGGTDALTPTLYHSGLSKDVGAVIEHYTRHFGLKRVVLIGYSMGGNLVLKLAGECGAYGPLRAVATVCPAIDLAVSSDALHAPANRLYEWHFLRRLLRRYRNKAALFPHIYTLNGIGPIRSLREFDDKIVARYCGFRDSSDYYYRAASARVLDQIAVPTLILRALDDPFIQLTPETLATIRANSRITLAETQHGGHCAFLSAARGNEVHWAEATVMRYALAAAS